ncbi:hypothetical protein DFP72DRAFT_1080968 [Ephemerocybe angulata]|uniref:Uncharacterized protein n=1 Tax=Ephemerocybe angulata TaxID=980116 RepID=A0A8H6LW64_9AGAR|nr:hypothetical protein DFP72DRAFT_1080968 [Tulosesus angulatus]
MRTNTANVKKKGKGNNKRPEPGLLDKGKKRSVQSYQLPVLRPEQVARIQASEDRLMAVLRQNLVNWNHVFCNRCQDNNIPASTLSTCELTENANAVYSALGPVLETGAAFAQTHRNRPRYNPMENAGPTLGADASLASFAEMRISDNNDFNWLNDFSLLPAVATYQMQEGPYIGAAGGWDGTIPNSLDLFGQLQVPEIGAAALEETSPSMLLSNDTQLELLGQWPRTDGLGRAPLNLPDITGSDSPSQSPAAPGDHEEETDSNTFDWPKQSYFNMHEDMAEWGLPDA